MVHQNGRRHFCPFWYQGPEPFKVTFGGRWHRERLRLSTPWETRAFQRKRSEMGWECKQDGCSCRRRKSWKQYRSQDCLSQGQWSRQPKFHKGYHRWLDPSSHQDLLAQGQRNLKALNHTHLQRGGQMSCACEIWCKVLLLSNGARSDCNSPVKNQLLRIWDRIIRACTFVSFIFYFKFI